MEEFFKKCSKEWHDGIECCVVEALAGSVASLRFGRELCVD
jgi:hypothetical protein